MGQPSAFRRDSHRPSAAKDRKAYAKHIGYINAQPRDDSALDFGLENFSFSHAHMAKWSLPPKLLAQLPRTLRADIESWTRAGAAVSTALHRLERLDGEAEERKNPKTTHLHLLAGSKGTSKPLPPVFEPSPPASPIASVDPAATSDNDKQGQSKSFNPRLPLSPPFTPAGANTPKNPTGDFRLTRLDAHRLSDALTQQPSTATDLRTNTTSVSKPSSRANGTETAHETENDITPAHNEINESAYDFYTKLYTTALHDLHSHALQRLKGCTRRVDRTCVALDLDLGSDLDCRSEKEKLAIMEFQEWWRTSGKVKMAGLEAEIGVIRERRLVRVGA